jgi:hypothetical protein
VSVDVHQHIGLLQVQKTTRSQVDERVVQALVSERAYKHHPLYLKTSKHKSAQRNKCTVHAPAFEAAHQATCCLRAQAILLKWMYLQWFLRAENVIQGK